MMREVRRSGASRARSGLRAVGQSGYDESFAARPDLVVVDGGKGQLAAALGGMAASGAEVAVAALAKQREEVFVPGRAAPLALPADTRRRCCCSACATRLTALQ